LSLPTAQIRWLFFDLGNTLVDETAATETRLQEVAACFERHGKRRSVEDIRSALREASVEFAPRLITAAIAKLTDDVELHRLIAAGSHYRKELEAPYAGAQQIIRMLSSRYRIAVIANQSLGTPDRLTRWGLMPLISACPSSAEIGLEKPDPEIFRLALARAGCMPEAAVMIGDRIDNDIRPARLQGWRTIRILQGFARFQSPRDRFDEADATVAELAGLQPLLLTETT